MNEPPPKGGPRLEQATPGVSPGGLVQPSEIESLPIGTPVDGHHLGNTDDVGPLDVHYVGDWSALVGDSPNAQAVTSDGELLFVLDVYLDAGVARRHRCRTRHLGFTVTRNQATPNFNNIIYSSESEGRGSRARNDVITLARGNKLSIFATFDYEDQPDNLHKYPSACHEMFGLFLRRLRRTCGTFPWIEVLEYGDENYRLHHHALFPEEIPVILLQDKWPHGLVVVSRLPDTESIGAKASYMAKHFDDDIWHRPEPNRYRIAKAIKRERPLRLIGTRQQIENELRNQLPNQTALKEWTADHPFSSGGYSWNKPV